ncbi:alpha/beta fold hydrolase [Mucilaginibacter ginkgonis]|uniref:Alpha/beta hydrolase n=1 Tax=Mucilaginibacter ginkgonis TaxID=2682091 RepID=A0A6I4I305_9SPHI|nr:alpha/beta hydrolase [Mucilaginibacter ginkgonis]QQL49085.1 alpha/beta hydrolase [Mucilaginibacter ginkgonis]
MKSLFLQFAIAILCCAFLSACKHAPYGNNKAVGKYYDVNGIKMYTETYGSGKPLLLLHGNGGSISTFAGVIPYLSLKYKVIVADGRAQGKTVYTRDSLNFEMMADDYAALLDKMHIDSANVYGWSDGGIVALEMAMLHPKKVRRFISSGLNLWPGTSAINSNVSKEEQEEYKKLKDQPKITTAQKERWRLLLLDMFEPHITLDHLHRIKPAGLIMGGDHDVIRQKHLRLIYDNIPNANLWIVPNTGHGVLFEHKYKFMWGLNKFFSGDFENRKVW